MRDAARIPEVLEALRRAWEANPDLRLGQLVIDAATMHNGANPYEIEEPDILEELKKLAPEHVHSFWTVQWHEEGLLQECKDETCRERRMLKYR